VVQYIQNEDRSMKNARTCIFLLIRGKTNLVTSRFPNLSACGAKASSSMGIALVGEAIIKLTASHKG
jgi:hypothetical protein